MNGTLFGDDDVRTPDKFTGRDTSPGKWFEATIQVALGFRYQVQRQVNIGRRIASTKHIVDFVVRCADQDQVLISTKWQGKSGTGEDKMMFEVSTLGRAIAQNTEYARAIVVLGGSGWNKGKRQYFTTQQFRADVVGANRVECLTLDDFLTRAYTGTL